jgi:hypothetical protein
MRRMVAVISSALVGPLMACATPLPRILEVTPYRPPPAAIHRLSVIVDYREFRNYFRAYSGSEREGEHAEEQYSQFLVNEVARAFGSTALDVRARSYPPQLAGTQSNPTDVAPFSPDAELALTLTKVYRGSFLFIGWFGALDYDVTLRELRSDTLVWHAQVHVKVPSGENHGNEARWRKEIARRLAVTIAEALKRARAI